MNERVTRVIKSENIVSPSREELDNRTFTFFQFDEIPYETLPANVVEEFEHLSSLMTPASDYRPRNFDKIYCIRHSAEDMTYAAFQTKQWALGEGEANPIVKEGYFFDHRAGEIIGEGHICNNLSGGGYSYVDYTATQKNFRKQGLGNRRLKMMGDASAALYGLPLHSSRIRLKDAAKAVEATWQSLVDEGIAQAYQGQNMTEFVFTGGRAVTQTPDNGFVFST